MLWRRSYDTPPPPIAADDEFSPGRRPALRRPRRRTCPRTECLKDVVARMLPVLGRPTSCPTCAAGKVVLVAAHGNSLRALVKHLDGISDEDIAGLNIPTGIPLVYELGRRPAPDRPRRPVPRPGGRRRGRRRRRQPGPLTSRRPESRWRSAHAGCLRRASGAAHDHADRSQVGQAGSAGCRRSPVTRKTTRRATETAWSANRS